jgi:hypothetical protein
MTSETGLTATVEVNTAKRRCSYQPSQPWPVIPLAA